MRTETVWAVVPVKRFSQAKSRLLPVLGSAACARLAELMLQDVLDILVLCQETLAGVMVVTADERAAAVARERGADVVAETSGGGINGAVGLAVRRLGQTGDCGMVVVPSDIPQLTPAAIVTAAAAIAATCAVAIIPATDDGGTNLLACRPANAIPPCFGAPSFARHCRAARAAGIAPQVLDVPELGLDIDRPENLAAFLSLNTPTRTHAFLSAAPVSDRLRRLCQVGTPSFACSAAGNGR